MTSRAASLNTSRYVEFGPVLGRVVDDGMQSVLEGVDDGNVFDEKAVDGMEGTVVAEEGNTFVETAADDDKLSE